MPEQAKISFTAAVLLSINIMVGAGILYAVGPMTASAGSMSFFGWPLIGLLFFPVIWCVAKAAQLFPGEGGFYHYCATGINPLAGFIAHWGYLLAYMSIAASLVTLLRNGIIHNSGSVFLEHYPVILNIVLVVVYTLLNLISLSKINKIQSVATLVKIAPILLVIALMAFYFDANLTFDFAELGNIGVTVSTVLFAFTGFEACCSLGGLMKDGPKKVASVILVGFFATLVLYFLFHIGLLYIMGAANLADHGAIAFPRFLGLSPALTAALQIGISGLVLFIWANSILGVSLANITNIHSLADRKLILGDKLLTTVNRNQRPIYAAIVHGVVLLALITFIADIDILFALTNLGIIVTFVLTLLAVFITQLKQKNYPQLAVTTLGFASCAVFIYYSWIKIPSLIYTLPLIIGMLAGIAMYKIQQSRQAALALAAS